MRISYTIGMPVTNSSELGNCVKIFMSYIDFSNSDGDSDSARRAHIYGGIES